MPGNTKSGNIGASIGVKIVDDPSHYGMVSVSDDGTIAKLVEKPPTFDGDQAIAGVYYIKDGKELKSALEAITERDFAGKEYQLTDALQYMIEQGSLFRTFDTGEYYDCGRLLTILDSNRRLVEKYATPQSSVKSTNSKIIDPCVISPDAVIEDSTIGPYVSIGSGAVIKGCTMKNTIVSQNTHLVDIETENAMLSNSGILSLKNGNH